MKNLHETFESFNLGLYGSLGYITVIDLEGHYQTQDLFEFGLN